MFRSIKAKITIISVFISLTVTLLTVSFFYYIFDSNLRKNLIQSTEFALQMTMNTITENINQLLYLSDWGNHAEFVYQFLTSNSENKLVKLNAYQRMKEEYDTNKAHDYLLRLMIGNQNNRFIQEIKFVSDSSNKDYEKATQADYFSTLLFSPDLTWIGFVEDPLYPSGTRQIIPVIRPIYHRYNTSIVGWTYLTISSDLLLDALSQYPITEGNQLYITFGEKTYLYENQSFFEYSFSDIQPIRTKGLYQGTTLYTITAPDGSKATLVRYPSVLNGWYLSQSISDTQLHSQQKTYRLILCIILLLSLSLGAILAFSLYRIINNPVAQLQKKMQEISKGDFSYEAAIEWNNEFGEIGRGINSLSTNIIQLMENRISAEKQQKELEYQVLQSQINPHFLYNTLNSIKWMATIQNATGIAEMTTSLSRLLKSISKGTRQVISIREEIELLKNYVLIQQYRYGGIITVTYQIEDNIFDYLIPKFTLQPIVENAMFHGIEAKGGSGEVKIAISKNTWLEQPGIYIEVTDNGIGMSKELIEQVLSESPQEIQHDFFRKIGINNVNKRIQFYFGEHYGISIKSELGKFTTMQIQLPCRNINDLSEEEKSQNRINKEE